MSILAVRRRRYQSGSVLPLVIFIIATLAITAAATVAIYKAWGEYKGNMRKEAELAALKKEAEELRVQNKKLTAELASASKRISVLAAHQVTKLSAAPAHSDILLEMAKADDKVSARGISELRSARAIKHELTLRSRQEMLEKQLLVARTNNQEINRLNAELERVTKALQALDSARVRAAARKAVLRARR